MEFIPFNCISSELRGSLSSTPLLPEEFALLAKGYHELCASLHGIHQLYLSYKWNYDKYAKELRIGYDDVVESVSESHLACGGKRVDSKLYMDVNCLVSNVISSGQSLIEPLRTFVKSDMGLDDTNASSFDRMIHARHGEKGVYFLFSNLRNYVQHGQLVVSLYRASSAETKASFDLFQLRNPIHFEVKGTFRDFLNQMDEKLKSCNAVTRRLSLGYHVEQYDCFVCEVYGEFLKCVKDHIKRSQKPFFDMLKKHRQYVGHFNGQDYVLYYENGIVHMVEGLQAPLSKTHSVRRQEIERSLKQAKGRYDQGRKYLKRTKNPDLFYIERGEAIW